MRAGWCAHLDSCVGGSDRPRPFPFPALCCSGEVFRAVLYGTTPCACKLFDFKAGAEERHWFLQEAGMLWGLSRHPNIVQFLGVAVAEEQGLILMELMRRGDLKSLLGEQLPDKRGRTLGWYNRQAGRAARLALCRSTCIDDQRPAWVLALALPRIVQGAPAHACQ